MGSAIDNMCDHALRTTALLAGKPSTETVTYNRDGADPITLEKPIQAESVWESELEDDSVVEWNGVDWLIPASQIEDLSPATPERGDYVEHTDAGGTVRRYDVMAPPGLRPWRFMDRGRGWLRVHTKLCSET